MNGTVTNVITAFLWDGQRVLLALRSDRVSTYPKHWAGISGYLESDDPVEWALVEIREECGVARQDLTLRRVGEPLDATDEGLGRTFRVHPSLWSIDICEGRPLLEGRKLAEELAEAGIPVTLLTDARAACLMKDMDLVFFGADAVLADGAVVNKVGSTQLVLAPRHFGNRVLVAAESLKLVRDDATFQFTAESNPPAEVWQEAPPGIDISNVYFEAVPSELVDELVTEQKLGKKSR